MSQNETTEEMLSLDKYFYEKELQATVDPNEKDFIMEKIRATEKLLNDLRY